MGITALRRYHNRPTPKPQEQEKPVVDVSEAQFRQRVEKPDKPVQAPKQTPTRHAH